MPTLVPKLCWVVVTFVGKVIYKISDPKDRVIKKITFLYYFLKSIRKNIRKQKSPPLIIFFNEVYIHYSSELDLILVSLKIVKYQKICNIF